MQQVNKVCHIVWQKQPLSQLVAYNVFVVSYKKIVISTERPFQGTFYTQSQNVVCKSFLFLVIKRTSKVHFGTLDVQIFTRGCKPSETKHIVHLSASYIQHFANKSLTFCHSGGKLKIFFVLFIEKNFVCNAKLHVQYLKNIYHFLYIIGKLYEVKSLVSTTHTK